MEHARHVAAVLDENGLVQAEFPAQLLVADRVDAALARHGLDRVTRHQADQKEGQ